MDGKGFMICVTGRPKKVFDKKAAVTPQYPLIEQQSPYPVEPLHKSLCCTPSADALKEGACDTDICTDDESLCDDSAGDGVSSVTRRALSVSDSGDDDNDDNNSEYYGELENRATKVRPGELREFGLKLASTGATLLWYFRRYPTGDKRKYLFRDGNGLASMLLKGGYDAAAAICSLPALTFLKIADLPKKAMQTEHFFEALLRAGWNKQYAAGVALNTFYEAVSGLTGVPSVYSPPSNTSADRLMTVLGDWGNMENLLLVKAGDTKAAIKIELVLKYVFSAFDYMNDATAEIVERKTLSAIKQEITNMDEHMPELKGIKAIFDEFMPAYKAAVVEKAYIFVKAMDVYVDKAVNDAAPNPMPAHIDLKWQDLLGF
ncbi:symbiotic chitinase [Stemphylium lycopersici]|uniref:Symbiotic chitinase n=1 Tax=Stemphylium lycopersici TaxID=183478 RepID=A0A364MSX1_STELY|nr:symbiotic chitinase [Stemphylium lycopersici]RAQ98902.1 symbiotic chitinase [Stemphylium lycopersici]RAR02095.1 symbiotic chitinase [Stemphylium lycopersici]